MNVYIKTPNSAPPSDSLQYVVAKNGVFLRKNNPVMKSILPVENIPFLEDQQPQLELSYPRFSQEQSFQIFGFFFQAYKKFHGESILLLHYHPKDGYRLFPPSQMVHRGAINYSPQDRFNGYLLVGSIHCHGRFMAMHSDGHSASDYEDEVNFDGLHITVGNINAKTFTISCSVMVDGRRFFLNPFDYLTGIKEVKIARPLNFVQDKPFNDLAPGSFGSPSATGPFSWQGYLRSLAMGWPDFIEPEALMSERPVIPMPVRSHQEHLGKKPILKLPNMPEEVEHPNWFLYKAPLSGKRGWDKFAVSGDNNSATSKPLAKFWGKISGKEGIKKQSGEHLCNPCALKAPFFFALDLPEGKNANHLEFPREWLGQLRRFSLVERMKLELSMLVEGDL